MTLIHFPKNMESRSCFSLISHASDIAEESLTSKTSKKKLQPYSSYYIEGFSFFVFFLFLFFSVPSINVHFILVQQ